MDTISFKELTSEFFGTLVQSAGITALLSATKNTSETVLLSTVVAVTVTIFYKWSGITFQPLADTITCDQPNWVKP